MNPLLQQTESAILGKADPHLQPAIQHVIEVGKHVMTDPQTRHMFFKALMQQDPTLIGQSMGGMAVILYANSGGKIPMQVLVPAANVLLCEALQFYEDSGAAKIDANFLAQATKGMSEMLLHGLHVNPTTITQLAAANRAKQSGAPSPAAPAAAAPAAPKQQAAPGGIISGAMQGGS